MQRTIQFDPFTHFHATDFSLTSISKLFASATENRRSRTDFLSERRRCSKGITREKFESSASSRLSSDRFFPPPSPRQKWWPGSAWFSGYYAFTVAQRHQVMDESRDEARIICFEANPKTSGPVFPNDLRTYFTATADVSPLNPAPFTAFDLFALNFANGWKFKPVKSITSNRRRVTTMGSSPSSEGETEQTGYLSHAEDSREPEARRIFIRGN